jgi:2-C-methyl-D-erythritol 2,4-cyclodiphosphate synthase
MSSPSDSTAYSLQPTAFRIGQGYDVHTFEPGDHVTLGGVRIAHDQGIKAHSDGDVLLHAVCDALLGAAAMGDIGVLFSDTDAQWLGADSRGFVRRVRELLAQRGYRVVNVDCTLLAEAPRLGKHRDTMRANIASDLGIDIDRVNVKATTSEGLGFVGRREGIASHAIALIERA